MHSPVRRSTLFLALVVLVLGSNAQSVRSQQAAQGNKLKPGDIIPGRLMVRMKKGSSPSVLSTDLARVNGQATGLSVERKLSEYLNVWLFTYEPGAVDKHRLLKKVRGHKGTGMAQFEHRMEKRVTPNDPMFTSPDKWPYVNDGSNGGVVDADTDADLAWDLTKGGTTANGDTIVVAVIDGGFQISHEDLNFFRNQAEVNGTSGVDDDGNGYTDDVNGWDVYNNDGTIPSDQHGTHVSGTVGGIGDNNTGFVGVNWSVEVMPIAGSSTNESTVVSAYDYAVKMRDLYNSTNGQKGAFIVATNSSFGVNYGDPANYPLWCAMYDTLGAYGITSAVAGPNLDIDIDQEGDVPGTCPSDHTICLTNTENDDQRATAGYGDINVDLGAPGTDILSTVPTNSYTQLTGTSQATPHVAGTIGLLYSVDCPDLMNLVQNDPDSASRLIKEAILKGTDQTTAMTNMTVSDGRLNIHKALLELDSLGYCDTNNTGCFSPYSLSAGSITDSSAVLYYDGPTAADSIKVQYKKSSSSTWTSAWTSSVDSFPIDGGLTGCTQYEFRLKAYCPTDTSAWAGPSTFQTAGCCSAPSAPTLISKGPQQLEVGWGSVFGASSYTLKYRSTGSSIWYSHSGISSTDTLLTDFLSPCHEYEFKVRADCDTGFSPYSPVTLMATSCKPCDSSFYCSSSGDDQYEWIDSVDIVGLSLSTGANGGYLFTGGPNAVLQADTGYVITLTPAWSGSVYPEYFRIWVDLNRDGTFDVPSEELFQKDSVTSSVTDTLFIPNNLSRGGTRMRVSMKWDGTPGPCETLNFGEVEDYCVRLGEPSKTALQERSDELGTKLFPNPAKDRIHLQLGKEPQEGTYLLLYDGMGAKVLQEPVDQQVEKIGLKGLSHGTYFYRIVGKDQLANGKLIIEEH